MSSVAIYPIPGTLKGILSSSISKYSCTAGIRSRAKGTTILRKIHTPPTNGAHLSAFKKAH